MRYRTASITTVTILITAVILASCLHEPTESNFISSRSTNLRIYQADNSISFKVKGSKIGIDEDANSGELTVVEQDIFGNTTNCVDTDAETFNTVDTPCVTKTAFTGTLVVEWPSDVELTEPLNVGMETILVPVLKEIWTLSLDYDGDNVFEDVYTNTRYISQKKSGPTKGQLSVHAYEPKLSGTSTYFWLNGESVDYNVVNPTPQTSVSPIVTELSPLSGISDAYKLNYNVLEVCDGNGITECYPVAGIKRNATYQPNTERLLTAFGNFEVYNIILDGSIRRPLNAVADVDLGYEFETNCNTEANAISSVPYQIVSASYTSTVSVFPDIGPLRIYLDCHYAYAVTHFLGGAVKLDGSNSRDAQGLNDSLIYTWTVKSQPTGSNVTLNVAPTTFPQSIAPTFRALVVGVYALSLGVSDGVSSSEVDEVFINVTGPPIGTQNQQPIANAGRHQNVATGAVVSLKGSDSYDVNVNDVITYQWTLTRPTGSAAELNNATAASPTFTADVDGTYTAQLIVNDGALDSLSDAVFITALSGAGNYPPIADAGNNQNVVVGQLSDKTNSVYTSIVYTADVSETTYPKPKK